MGNDEPPLACFFLYQRLWDSAATLWPLWFQMLGNKKNLRLHTVQAHDTRNATAAVVGAEKGKGVTTRGDHQDASSHQLFGPRQSVSRNDVVLYVMLRQNYIINTWVKASRSPPGRLPGSSTCSR